MISLVRSWAYSASRNGPEILGFSLPQLAAEPSSPTNPSALSWLASLALDPRRTQDAERRWFARSVREQLRADTRGARAARAWPASEHPFPRGEPASPRVDPDRRARRHTPRPGSAERGHGASPYLRGVGPANMISPPAFPFGRCDDAMRYLPAAGLAMPTPQVLVGAQALIKTSPGRPRAGPTVLWLHAVVHA